MTERIRETFDTLEWHDSTLLNINIDRSAPGKRDEVEMLVEWTDGQKQKIRFTDCYGLDAQMNFGVIGPDSILEACCISDSPKLTGLKQQWAVMGVDLVDIQCFEITTNTTASVIRVFARRFEISAA